MCAKRPALHTASCARTKVTELYGSLSTRARLHSAGCEGEKCSSECEQVFIIRTKDKRSFLFQRLVQKIFSSRSIDGSVRAPSMNSSSDSVLSWSASICLNILSVRFSGVETSSSSFIIFPIILYIACLHMLVLNYNFFSISTYIENGQHLITTDLSVTV